MSILYSSAYPGRHQSQGRLVRDEGRDEGGVHLGGPGEVLGIPTQSISQRVEDQSSSKYKLPVKVHHPQEPLQGWAISRWQKSSKGRDMLMERSRPGARDGTSKILILRTSKNTLLQVDGEALEAAEVKEVAEVEEVAEGRRGEVDDQLGS